MKFKHICIWDLNLYYIEISFLFFRFIKYRKEIDLNWFNIFQTSIFTQSLFFNKDKNCRKWNNHVELTLIKNTKIRKNSTLLIPLLKFVTDKSFIHKTIEKERMVSLQISSNYAQISPVSDLRVDFRTRVVIHGG